MQAAKSDGAGLGLSEHPRLEAAIVRPRLLKRLASTGTRAVVVSAPGGYGKSTLLAQWVEQDPRPTVWLQVKQSAADALAIAQGINTGLVAAGLAAGPVLLPDREDAAEWQPALRPLAEMMAAVQVPLVIVIDDAGLISGEAWEIVLDVVLEAIPPGSTLALATRRGVPRTLRRLRTTGSLLELLPAELAMTTDEAAALYRSLGLEAPRDSPPVGASIASADWPAAVYLEARARQDAGSSSTSRQAAAATIDDFLRDEVLAELDHADLLLLTRSSILAELSGPACDAVSLDVNSLRRLVALARELHLIVPLDEESTRFAMHQLLRDFLARDLALVDPAGLAAAHGRASSYFEGVDDIDAAVFHARHAGDDERFAALVWTHCGRRLASAQSLVVARWLEGLDPKRLEASCLLALAQAWASSHQGDLESTERLLFLAQEHCRRPGVPQQVVDAVELLRVTLGATPIDDIVSGMTDVTVRLGTNEWATLSHYMSGIGQSLSGDVAAARESFSAGAQLARSMALPVMEAHCLAGLVDIALDLDEAKSATVAMGRLRELVDTIGIDRVVTAAPVLATSAQMYLVDGQVAQARAEADRALRLAAMMRQVAPWAAVLIRVRLCALYLAIGMPAMAEQLLDEARELHGPASMSPVLDGALAQLAGTVESLGLPHHESRAVLTTAEIRVMQYLPTHLTFAEIGAKLFVSRNTIKSQVHSIYGKLSVNSRSDAVEAARSTGLLR